MSIKTQIIIYEESVMVVGEKDNNIGVSYIANINLCRVVEQATSSKNGSLTIL